MPGSRTGWISRKQPRSRGFNLVEVVLALGIISFSLLPMLGILAIGFDSFRQSERQTQASNIADQICMDYAPTLGDSATTNLFFSKDGKSVSESRADFSAEVTVSEIRWNQSPVNISQSNGRALTVKVTSQPRQGQQDPLVFHYILTAHPGH